MQRFKTLMLREWMQHQRGWLVMLALPTLLILAVSLFGQVNINLADEGVPDTPGALPVALGVIAATGGLTLLLAWLAAMLQAPGLARRDVQDRSIEFWLSLPASHTQSVGAMLLMHLLLWPALALLMGLAGGVLASLLLTAKLFGVAAWFSLPWSSILVAGALLALRLLLGLLLATLWLAPLTLGTMAAAAWLKRWGVPIVVIAVLASGVVLENLYDNHFVGQTLRLLVDQAMRAFFDANGSIGAPGGVVVNNANDIGGALSALPAWLLQDAGSALARLAAPAFLGTLAASALAFGLLVLRRQRGA